MKTVLKKYEILRSKFVLEADEDNCVCGKEKSLPFYSDIVNLVRIAKAKGIEKLSSATSIYECLYKDTGVKRVNKKRPLTYEVLKEDIVKFVGNKKVIYGFDVDLPWYSRLNRFLSENNDSNLKTSKEFYKKIEEDTNLKRVYPNKDNSYQKVKNQIIEFVGENKTIEGKESELPWYSNFNRLIDKYGKEDNDFSSFDNLYEKIYKDTGIKRIKYWGTSCEQDYEDLKEEVLKYLNGKKVITGLQSELPFENKIHCLVIKAKSNNNTRFSSYEKVYQALYEDEGIVRVKMRQPLTLERLRREIEEEKSNGFKNGNRWKKSIKNYALKEGLSFEQVMHQLGYTDYRASQKEDYTKNL